MCLITRLVILANKQGYYLPVVTEGWSAHPLAVRACFLMSKRHGPDLVVTGMHDADQRG